MYYYGQVSVPCFEECWSQNAEEREAILQLEEELLNSELEIPVYFAEVPTLYIYTYVPYIHSA